MEGHFNPRALHKHLFCHILAFEGVTCGHKLTYIVIYDDNCSGR
jgi:hypothetical protein